MVTGSVWALLIYLLMNDEDDIENTYYFFIDTGVHGSIRKNFHKSHTFHTIYWDSHYRLSVIYYTFARFFYRLRWPFLIYRKIYGIDLGRETQAVIGYRKYCLIEDGVGDYDINNSPLQRSVSLKHRIMYGPIYERYFGNNKLCYRIILTRKPSTPVMEEKGQTINIEELWNSSSETKRRLILSKFNVCNEDLQQMCSRNCLILTQPLSEDGMISEEEKLEIYRKYILDFGEENTIIKTHPREKTDYRKTFPNAMVFDKIVPMQLIRLIGTNFKKVATLSSSSALDFLNDNIEVYFEGTSGYPSIERKYGHITLDMILNISLPQKS